MQVTDGVFQRLEKCVVMKARGMHLEQVKQHILQDVESHFRSAGLLDDTPQQKPGLRVSQPVSQVDHIPVCTLNFIRTRTTCL